jgi:hypothetical protein
MDPNPRKKVQLSMLNPHHVNYPVFTDPFSLSFSLTLVSVCVVVWFHPSSISEAVLLFRHPPMKLEETSCNSVSFF